MRSDRNIQRTPKRPVRTDGDTPSPAPAPATHPAASVPVSHKPPAEARYGAPERRDRPPRGEWHGHAEPPERPRRAAPVQSPARPERSTPPGRPDRPPRPQPPQRTARPQSAERPAPPPRAAGPDRAAERPTGPRRVPRDDAPPPQTRPTPRPPTPRTSTEDGIRLSKALSDRGLASRREADDWIAAGWVKVDGQMAVLGQRVTAASRIEVDPAAHQQQAKRVTILLHKPIGYVSGQAEDGHEPAAVLVTAANRWAEGPLRRPFHPGHGRHLAPAGRLDIDSTGLLVLTQDGRIARHLIGEDSDVEKEYLVRVEYEGQAKPQGVFPEEQVERLRHGLALDGVQLKPAKVSWANEDQLRFVLREGRKRQIRRMCELVGLKVVGLKRVRIGRVVLGKLPPGQWRYLRDDERF